MGPTKMIIKTIFLKKNVKTYISEGKEQKEAWFFAQQGKRKKKAGQLKNSRENKHHQLKTSKTWSKCAMILRNLWTHLKKTLEALASEWCHNVLLESQSRSVSTPHCLALLQAGFILTLLATFRLKGYTPCSIGLNL